MQESRNIKEALDKLLNESDKIFIVPHNRPDMDAFAAAIGMSLICKKNKKLSFIVIDDDNNKIESATRKSIEEVQSDFDIIKANDIPNYITKDSSMIAVDVNKDYLISTKKYLEDFKHVLVLDHHKKDEHTIKTPYLFINDKLSSASEEVSRLLFLYGVKINELYANYLLAGIILDTNKLSKNVTPDTFAVATKLLQKGADTTIANNMFLEDFEHDRAIQRLVDNKIFPSYVFAIASDKEDSNKIYDVEDIAKASDYLLKYQVNATFAIGYIDEETISISARSKGIIDVSKIMKAFGGGGNEHAAAARIKGKSIEEIKQKLGKIIIPCSYLEYVDQNQIDNDKDMKMILKK